MGKSEKDVACLNKIATKKRLDKPSKHLLLCVGPKCCSEEKGMQVWKHLKKRTKSLQEQGIFVMRSKVGCLRVCAQGPLALLYPEGTWYHSVDENFADLLIEECFVKGNTVEQNVFFSNDLKSKD